MGDEVVHGGGVGQRRGVAEVALLVRRDLAEDPPHDLPAARLRQRRRELHEVGLRDGADDGADVLDELQVNMREVIGMLLEDGEPRIEGEFVGTQVVSVAA